MRKVFITAILAAVATLGVAACGSSSSTTTTTSTIGPLSVQTPDGQVSLSLNGQLPPNWPSEFPIPNGAVPSGSGSLGNSDQTGLVGVYSTTMTPTDAFNFYANSTTLTTSNKKTAGLGDTFVGSLDISGPYSGSVTVTNVGSSGTLIIVHLTTGGTTTGSTTSSTTGSTTGSTASTTGSTATP